MEDITLIEKLSQARGISGFEDEVVGIVRECLKDIADFEEDSMRNLYIYPRGNTGKRPCVMLDAHSDEVGFMVQAIKPDGTLRFIPVGGWNEKALPSSKVQIRTKTGYIRGVIAAMPPHLMSAEQRNAPVKCENLVIDIGASSAEEAASYGVEVGAPVAPFTFFDYDREHGIMQGKAFDDRLGVAALVKCIRELDGKARNVDVIGVISSQEEVGERGIRAVMSRVKADAAICLEGCPADDTFSPAYMVQDALRGGVMLRHMDATVICTPRFTEYVKGVAAKEKIKLQFAVRSGGGNNGAYIISANGGTPVIVAGLPVRYIHSFNCIAAKEDFDSAVALTTAIVRDITEETIKGF